jgi:hypothetical protein
MDSRLVRRFLRHLLGRTNAHANQQMEEFFTARGITPDIRFEQLAEARPALIGTRPGQLPV